MSSQPLAPGGAHRADEPLGDPRDPQAHRAARASSRSPAACRRPTPSRSRRCATATARVLRDNAARGAAVRGERRLRAAARMGRRGDARPGRGTSTPSQVLITTGSQQGLDLVGKVLIDAGSRGRGRVADLPRRAAGVRALRARVRGDRLRRRRAAARGAGRRRPRRALPLRAAELPEPERPLASARRAAPRSSRAARATRPADRRGQPLRRPLVRRAAAAAARRALAPRARSTSALLQGARAGPAARLRDRAAERSCPSCCRPSRPPTCTRPASTSAWCTR